jgi:hypothetical protein
MTEEGITLDDGALLSLLYHGSYFTTRPLPDGSCLPLHSQLFLSVSDYRKRVVVECLRQTGFDCPRSHPNIPPGCSC